MCLRGEFDICEAFTMLIRVGNEAEWTTGTHSVSMLTTATVMCRPCLFQLHCRYCQVYGAFRSSKVLQFNSSIFKLVLITNRKSHTGFRLIQSSMTLNDLEGRNSPYFAFFSTNSIALLANYVTVVEDRPIMSAKYCLPVPVFHFWPKLTHPAARSFCDSWATC